MKTSKTASISLAILSGILGGALTLWLIRGDDARKIGALEANALCVVHLPEGTPSASVTFKTYQPIDMFQVGIRKKTSEEALSISISGDQGLVASATGIKGILFGLGRNIQPGTYIATLRQDVNGKGAVVFIASESPVFITGWQILSRTYVGLWVLSGICAILLRKDENSRARALSVTAFHSLLLVLVLMFVYLLFHEGGHAIAQITFGHFDLARSDFWGIHGRPHSGAIMGPQLEPWQQTVISFAGPVLPTVAGFGFFFLWVLPVVRKIRSSRPMVNLYFSAIVAFLVFPEAVCEPAYLLGFISAEGDLIGYVTKAGGHVWLVKSLLWGSFLISALILYTVMPQVLRAWKALFLEPG